MEIRVIGLHVPIMPETCIKMLRNLSEKLGEKFPSTTLGYSLVRIAHLNDAFFGIIELGAIAVEGRQSLHQKDEKITKRDCHFIVQKWNFDFCTYPGKNVINLMLVERKASCHLARANLAHMQAENVQKVHFLLKSCRCQWVKPICGPEKTLGPHNLKFGCLNCFPY